jgi:tetratricopeptide (TPR) repeat protein
LITKKDKHLAAAQKFLERGQQEKALAEFAGVVQEDPKDTRTWLKMAEIYARRGAIEQARDIYVRTGDIYCEQGFLQKAVAVYKNVLKLAPGLPEGHLRLGEVYRRLGLVADALQQLELGAAALQRAGRAAEALPALRAMVELHPENVVSRIKLAESASQAGAIDEAVGEFANAAEQLKAQGRGDEWVRVAERLLFHQPQNFALARELAAAYIVRGNPRLALPKLQPALKAAPRDPANVELLARAFEPLDAPKAVSVWRELAQIHDEAGRAGERDAALRAALSIDRSDAQSLSLARRWGTSTSSPSPATPLARPPRPTPVPPAAAGGSPSHLPPPRRSPSRPPPPPPAVATHRPPPSLSPSLPTPPPLTPGPNPDVSRILAEADVFVKYGLLDRAADHIRRVFEIDRDHPAAREKLGAVLAQLGRRDSAAEAGLGGGGALTPPPAPARARSAGAPGAPADLAAELEQVDFFLEQRLIDEARSTLGDLARRYGNHPLLAAKAREVDGAAAVIAEAEMERTAPGAVPQENAGGGARAGEHAVPVAVVAGGGKVDLSTHGDLGIAYKEMGLYDAALAEFKLLMADPAREVFALTMIGECLESKGTLTDAVVRYKEALNCPEITAPESLLLYYLLGTVFERLGDPSEALYFYEKVGKRDPSFRDVAAKIAALKPRTARHHA